MNEWFELNTHKSDGFRVQVQASSSMGRVDDVWADQRYTVIYERGVSMTCRVVGGGRLVKAQFRAWTAKAAALHAMHKPR